MPITSEHVGRSYPPAPPYLVSAEKIAEFARALGDENPAYAGQDPIAPPTFVAQLASAAWGSLFNDEELGLELKRTIHTDQRFHFNRPLRAGDEVQSTLTITKARPRGNTAMVGVAVEIATTAGEVVCTADSTFLHSGEETV